MAITGLVLHEVFVDPVKKVLANDPSDLMS
jgi:hypothetical protein